MSDPVEPKRTPKIRRTRRDRRYYDIEVTLIERRKVKRRKVIRRK